MFSRSTFKLISTVAALASCLGRDTALAAPEPIEHVVSVTDRRHADDSVVSDYVPIGFVFSPTGTVPQGSIVTVTVQIAPARGAKVPRSRMISQTVGLRFPGHPPMTLPDGASLPSSIQVSTDLREAKFQVITTDVVAETPAHFVATIGDKSIRRSFKVSPSLSRSSPSRLLSSEELNPPGSFQERVSDYVPIGITLPGTLQPSTTVAYVTAVATLYSPAATTPVQVKFEAYELGAQSGPTGPGTQVTISAISSPDLYMRDGSGQVASYVTVAPGSATATFQIAHGAVPAGSQRPEKQMMIRVFARQGTSGAWVGGVYGSIVRLAKPP